MISNIYNHKNKVSKYDRGIRLNQKPCVLWFTGLSGSGKSTIANMVEFKLHQMKFATYLLDGDNIRLGLNKDLEFSKKGRIENIRRLGEVSKLFVDAGIIVLVAAISPLRLDRNNIRKIVNNEEFIEIFIDTPLEVCEKRDPKGLYKKARSGNLKQFTGIDSPYENPLKPEIHIKTVDSSIEESVKIILHFLKKYEYLSYK